LSAPDAFFGFPLALALACTPRPRLPCCLHGHLLTFNSPVTSQEKALRDFAQFAAKLRGDKQSEAPLMQSNGWSLRDLYRSLEIPGANRLRDTHAALDSPIRAAYGMKEQEDPLAFLLRLNLYLADKEAKNQTITTPSLPTVLPGAEDFVSKDCICP
jgi:hypothetical protein